MSAAVALALLLSLESPAPPSQPAADLDRLLALALEHSPALEQARARTRAAAARVDLNRADRRPTLDLETRWSRTNNPPAAFMSILNQRRLTPALQASLNDPDPVSDWTTSVTLRYLLTDFGGRGARLRAAESELEREERLEEAARREVVAAVRTAWQDLASARAAIATWESTLELLRADERLTRARFEEGAVLRSDLLSVGVRLGETREELLGARHSAEIALARLRRIVGDQLPPLDLDPAALGRPRPPEPEGELVARALGSHPQVAALDAATRAAESAVGAARASRRPRLLASAGWEAHGDSESLGWEQDSWLVGVALQLPLHDAGRAAARTAEAVARKEEVLAARREVELELELAARTAHRRLREALSRIDLAEQAVESAAAAHAIVRERYGAGLVPVTALLETERRLTEARVRGVQARATAWKAAALLEQVAGRSEP